MIPLYVLTNDRHLWLLSGFARQFNQYWGEVQRVNVVGYAEPDPFNIPLPRNFSFTSLGAQRPANEWSTGLLEMLRRIDEPYFLFMLEDYWLTRAPELARISDAYDYMKEFGYRILRVDLSGDRAQHLTARTYADWRGTRLVQTPAETPYQISFQAAIWNRDLLLDILMPGENPWQAEIEGSKRFAAGAHPNYLVLGTKPACLHYEPVYRSKTGTFRLDLFTENDREALKGMVRR